MSLYERTNGHFYWNKLATVECCHLLANFQANEALSEMLTKMIKLNTLHKWLNFFLKDLLLNYIQALFYEFILKIKKNNFLKFHHLLYIFQKYNIISKNRVSITFWKIKKNLLLAKVNYSRKKFIIWMVYAAPHHKKNLIII